MLREHDLRAALREVPHLTITDATTGEDAEAATRNVAKIGNLTLGVMSYTGQTPWERHPDGDELLLVLDGELEVTTLTDDGPVKRTLRAGEAFVCPQGLWHRQFAEKSVSMLYGTPTATSEISVADDPRVAPSAAAPAARRAVSCRSCISRALRAPPNFTRDVFGATVSMHDAEPGGLVSHAMLKMGETTVMLSDPTSAHIRDKEAQTLSRPPDRTAARPCICISTSPMRTTSSGARSRREPKSSTRWRTRSGATGAAESRTRTVTCGSSGRR